MTFQQRFPAYMTQEASAKCLAASKKLHALIKHKREARAITEAIRASVNVVALRGAR